MYALKARNEPRLSSPEMTRLPPSHRTCDQPEHRQELERRHEHSVQPRDGECAVDDRSALRPELLRERLARAEPLHDADADDRLLDERGRGAPARLEALRAGVVPPRVQPAGDADQRQRDQHDQRELRVDHEEHDPDSDDGEHVTDRVADRVHHPGDMLGVGRGAAHELARPDAVVVARVQPQCVREDRVADTRVRPCPVLDRVEVPHGAGGHLEHAHRQAGAPSQISSCP